MSTPSTERMTLIDAEETQRRLVGGLHALGLGPGDRLAVIAGNSARFVNLAMGALRAGIVPVLLNPALLAHEREAILADAEPSLLLDEPAVLALDGAPVRDLSPVPLGRPMLYTSGTTGTPKGVWAGVLSESDGRAMYHEEIDCWAFGPDEVHLVTSRLYHSAPLRFAMCSLLAGGEVVVLRDFTPAAWAAAVEEHRPTSTFAAPAHLQRVMASGLDPDVGSFRRLLHAGAPCPPRVKEWAVERFPEGSVWEFYGSTEGQFTAASTEDWRTHPTSVGRARPGRRLRIDDDGIIWCGVPDHARFEYWNRPEATASAWRADEFSVFDLGRLDDDDYLHLDGRRDDLVITGGVNVYPLEVELELRRCPGVEDLAVFGVDDERWGHAVWCAVVGPVDVETLDAWAGERLAAHKRPKRIVSVEEIPTTPTGKVRRGRLADDLGLT